MQAITRRDLLRAGVAAAAAGWGFRVSDTPAVASAAQSVHQDPGVQVLNPLGRVPLSFIIDDSTCLVNMGHFCMPQFTEAWPQQQAYRKPWKSWPREIPDAFVREFGQWCAEHGVKGKYSLVPYPACVGWLDRELPGWSRRELQDSLKLVRELMVPSWDIHPEMITHTRLIDLRTGRPFEEITPATMENWYPDTRKSVDELAAYMAYALRILKNCGIPCEGITTPGGFGNSMKTELSLAARQAITEVFSAEVPHYFKYVAEGTESTQPKLEHIEGAATESPRLIVNVPAGTGDWFGGWDGDEQPECWRYAAKDAMSGRMVELIERGEPAIMLCHWPGLYTHGTKKGFEGFKQVILALESRFRDRIIWMKTSELARYWAARKLTRIERNPRQVALNAPFACPRFTAKITGEVTFPPRLIHNGQPLSFREVNDPRNLQSGTLLRQPKGVTICFDLSKGRTVLSI